MESVKQNQKTPFVELLKGIPGLFGLHVGETPSYEVLQKIDGVEIRQYHPLMLAKVTVPGNFEHYQDKAFFKLADYIFGANAKAPIEDTHSLFALHERSHQIVEPEQTATPTEHAKPHEQVRMTMTTPVLQEQTDKGWAMSFILPVKYHIRNTPQPLDPDVQIVALPERLMAVLTYHGNNTEEKMKARLEDLRVWLSHQRVHPVSNASFAQYDQPFTIPFLKRNEVLIEVKVLH